MEKNTQQETVAISIRATLLKAKDEIGSALPAVSGIDPERMIQLAMSLFSALS